MMKLADYFTERDMAMCSLAKQVGVDYGVVRLPERKDFDLTDAAHWASYLDGFMRQGIRPWVIEPLPNSLYDMVKCGLPGAEEATEKIKAILALMGRFHLPVLCLNFMAHIGWLRTSSNHPLRGGALGTAFRLENFVPQDDFSISAQQLWHNLSEFFHEIVPVAEKHDVRLALHPDDPPVSALGGVSRILTSLEAIDKAVHLVDSPCLGVTLCQGCYSAMGEDINAVIRHFAGQDKLFFVHFRDICGVRDNFYETFHDDGQTDMAQAIRTYAEVGYDGPVRVDHVPAMAGEENGTPGYTRLGRLYAIGYLKGLMDGCETGNAGCI